LGIPENKLRVITPEVGGGFGSKLNVYAEERCSVGISMQLAQARQMDRDTPREYSSHDPWRGQVAILKWAAGTMGG